MSRVLVWDDPRMEAHDPGPGHPERPDRLRAIRSALLGHPAVEWRVPRLATAEELATVHDPDYVGRVLETRGRAVQFDEDTATSVGSVEAALLAAGAVQDAVDAVINGGPPDSVGAGPPSTAGLALVRPPGHHAERAFPMGFCLFNNIAIAAERARRSGVERVLIVDWDIHHGNGTQHIFEARPDVMFFSTHQGYGFWPGSGRPDETGLGNVINCPMRPGDGHEALLDAFRSKLVPAADRFAPGLVLVSAGFDAHRADPLGGMTATDQTFADLTRITRDLAIRHCGGRIVLALEGGYDLAALGCSVRACVDVLAES